MLRKRLTFCGVIPLAVALAIGCGSEPPTAPSALPGALSAYVPGTFMLSGVVTDSSGGRIAGARVEAIDRLRNRWSSTTDEEGIYSISGLEPKSYTVRALKDGYEETAQQVNLAGNQRLNFTLSPMSPNLQRISGRYSLTLTTSETCTQLPETIERTIVVPATITQYGSAIQIDVGDGYPIFDGAITADAISFEYGNCDECDCCWGHDAGPTHIAYISALAQGSVSGSTISGLLNGTFYYHPRASRGRGPLTTCRAADHRFVFSH